MMENLAYQIKSKYNEVTILLSKLRNLFQEYGMHEQDRTEMGMCLVEALNNVVRYSYNADTENIIILEVDIEADSIIFRIIDSGYTRTDLSKPTLNYDPHDIENLPEGGMGLFITYRLID